MIAAHRILALLAACAATLLVVVATAGAPAAVRAADVALAPPTTGVPHQGDAVHYRFEDGSFAFRWNGTAVRAGPFGGPVEVDLVVGAIEAGAPRPQVFEAAYPAGPAPLTYAWTLGNDDQPQEDVLGDYRWDGAYVSYGDFPNPEACLMRAGWQGVPVEEIVGRALGEMCPGLAPREELSPFASEGRQTIQGTEAHVLAASAQLRHQTLTMRLWLVEGLAYPVRAQLEEAWYTGYSGVRTLELVGFEPGSEPLAAPPAPAMPVQRPGARFEDPGLWGIVEGDPAAYPFAPSEAIAAFRDPIQFASFQDYLATHPEARVVDFSLAEDHTSRQAGGPRPWIWRFTFDDPQGEGWIVQARKATPVAGPFAVGLPVSVVVGTDLGPVTLAPLDPEARPTLSIAASDALALWRSERAGSEGEPNWIWGALQPELNENFHGNDAFLRVGRRDVVVQPQQAGVVQDATLASWRDIIPATGAVSSDSGGVFGDQYGVETFDAAAQNGWSVPAPVASARTLRSVAYPAAAGLLAGALLLWSPERPLRLVLALFSRLARGDVVEHPRRGALLAAIRSEPGIHGALLAQRLGIGNGALLYHLAVLERERIVAAVQDGRVRRYFAAGSMPRDAMAQSALLRTPSFRAVHEAIVAAPGISLADVAQRAGLSPPAAHHAVERLVEAGLVRRERDGRRVALYPAASAAARFA